MLPDHEAEANATLLDHLLNLHDIAAGAKPGDARGKLANMRYAMRDRLHEEYPVGRVFPAFVEGALTEDDYRNEWRTLIAGLFGYSHDDVPHCDNTSLGKALQRLPAKRHGKGLESRFMALLNADDEHLPGHLRQVLSLLKADRIGLDWRRLLNDVTRWRGRGKPIQKQWVHEFYKQSATSSSTAQDPPGVPTP